ncbi:hypothetical protein HDU93_005825 [Gonapodya sp. JEL0774]|nr:hypothetical protein HDU93_005825 [Gonapodya sp. JEL0774]
MPPHDKDITSSAELTVSTDATQYIQAILDNRTAMDEIATNTILGYEWCKMHALYLQGKTHQLHNIIANLQAQKAGLQKQINTLKVNVEEMQAYEDTLQRELNDVIDLLATLQEESEEAKLAIQTATVEMDRLQIDVKKLQDKKAREMHLVEQAEAVLDRIQDTLYTVGETQQVSAPIETENVLTIAPADIQAHLVTISNQFASDASDTSSELTDTISPPISRGMPRLVGIAGTGHFTFPSLAGGANAFAALATGAADPYAAILVANSHLDLKAVQQAAGALAFSVARLHEGPTTAKGNESVEEIKEEVME